MHMADALVSPAVGLSMTAVSVAAVGVSVLKVKRNDLNEKTVPLMGVAGALIFAAQMINFAIPGTGASGHIAGGILLSGLLGGAPAFLSMTAVLIIQCLFFADGGLLALGCNVFNLGVIPCLLIYPLVFKTFTKNIVNYNRITIASIVSVIFALELGAFCVVAQTYISNITELPFGIFISLMLPIHLVIGLIEGIVTAAILCFIYRTRPEIISSARSFESGEIKSVKRANSIILILAAMTIVVGGLLSLFVSANPDGLEWAINKTKEKTPAIEAGTITENEKDVSGFENTTGAQNTTAILPGYAFASDPENAAGTSVSGIVGAVITFALACAAGLVITKVKNKKKV